MGVSRPAVRTPKLLFYLLGRLQTLAAEKAKPIEQTQRKG